MPSFAIFIFVLVLGLFAMCFLLLAVVDGFLTDWNPVKHYHHAFKGILHSKSAKPAKPLTFREKLDAEGKW